MVIFSLFAPLAPTLRYPPSTFDMTLFDRPYDLPIRFDAGDALDAAITSDELGFVRLDRYCDVDRINLLRNEPSRIDAEARGMPAYAEVEADCDLHEPGVNPARGYKLRRVIASSKVVEQVLRLLHEGKLFDEQVQKHLLRLDSFLRESGGLELLSALYYFDDISRRKVRGTAEKVLPALTETRRRKLRFRDVV
jgi:hypothetical protein